MMVLVHHETIYLDRLTPHVNSIAIVSSSMKERMNSVFIYILALFDLICIVWLGQWWTVGMGAWE